MMSLLRRFAPAVGTMLCLGFALSVRAADVPAIAPAAMYVAEITAELDTPWPQNRAINIVAHGHSVPAGYFATPVVDTFNAYPHLLHEALKKRHPNAVINVIVTAIGGENSLNGAKRFERDVLVHQPDVVLIDYGLNDRGIPLKQAKESWVSMITRAQAHGAKVILLTPTADMASKMEDPRDPLSQQAAQNRELAAQYHVGLADSYAAIQKYLSAGGALPKIMSSRNHPNRTGHEMVVKELMNWFPAATPELRKTTHVYKTVGDVKIQADVYRSAGKAPRPVLVWIHGGALMMGGRNSVPARLRSFCAREDVVLVSLDYRLAPQVKLPEIVDDLRDAFQWLHNSGPELFGADTSRVVVSGGSAGGFLTMLMGTTLQPRPTALLSYWGYGDVDGPWTYAHSKDHGTTAAGDRAAVMAGMGKKVVTNTDDPAEQKSRPPYYRLLRQSGMWGREMTGVDVQSQPGGLDRFSPVKNLTKEYPPLFMIHGTADLDVPYACSEEMDHELSKLGVEHQLLTIPEAGHGVTDGDPRLVSRANSLALEFLRKHLKP